eukprot:CAMPEP_0177779754 /NCGR_PEP_ID=MMETSP0491_2-20121128/16794_1 /TAXON_ID=63592 /ORGANISM="Tetraselmis chuii, Strain PLY429" /LENGTH=833 /DNA_ID=CAMNT_0019299391 /DNA_START=115 /DNA_END=2617 /DNA_ORIENTATION=-
MIISRDSLTAPLPTMGMSCIPPAIKAWPLCMILLYRIYRAKASNALAASLRFYYVQRSGTAPPLPSWRGDCYTSDGADEGLDLSGGWFDAGDHVKFMLPMTYSATALAWGALSFPEGYLQTGQDAVLVDHLRFVTDFFLKAWDPDTERLVGQIGDGNLDHSFWKSCEVNSEARPVFFLTPDCPGTEVAAEMAAALSASALVLRNMDSSSDVPAYVDRLITAARQLYQFADTHRGSYSDCVTNAQSFYRSWSGYVDELAWGAAWLYKATGETQYLATAEQRYAELNRGFFGWTLAWDDKAYGAAILLMEETGDPLYEQHVRANLDHWINTIPTTPGGLKVLDRWGSLRYASNAAFLALKYAAYRGDVDNNDSPYASFATSQIDYILGDNPQRRTFVAGLGDLYPVNPHHRTASGTWGNNVGCCPEQNRHVLYGALVGGPTNQDDSSYVDDRSDYVANEVATDYNALFTGAVAGMLQMFRGGGQPPSQFPEEQPTPDDEFSVVATVNSQGVGYTELKVLLQQRTAWPARRVPLSYRYYADFSDLLAQQLDPLQVVALSTAYMEFSPIVSELRQLEGAVYFFEVSWSAEDAPYPGKSGAGYEAETQVRMTQTTGDASAWNRENDPSYSAIQGATTIPIFENGVLAFGSTPSPTIPIPDETTTPAPAPATPTPAATNNTTTPSPTVITTSDPITPSPTTKVSTPIANTPAPTTTTPAPPTTATIPASTTTTAAPPTPTTPTPPSSGYCSWRNCDGIEQGGPWCNQSGSFCGTCGGRWCTAADDEVPPGCSTAVSWWGKCGGGTSSDWSDHCCKAGSTCVYSNPWYSQCIPSNRKLLL